MSILFIRGKLFAYWENSLWIPFEEVLTSISMHSIASTIDYFGILDHKCIEELPETINFVCNWSRDFPMEIKSFRERGFFLVYAEIRKVTSFGKEMSLIYMGTCFLWFLSIKLLATSSLSLFPSPQESNTRHRQCLFTPQSLVMMEFCPSFWQN